MKALKYIAAGHLEIQEETKPVPTKGEVLLKVRACGICGSDVHGFLGLTGRRLPPMTMGHEFAAEVAELGEDAEKFHVGDGVIVQPIHFCGECENCQKGLTNMCLNKKFFGVLNVNGAMAEYVAVPEKLLFPLPQQCSYEIGALAEPYAVGYGAVKKAGGVGGQNVLVIGAGTIGLGIIQIIKQQNPGKIIVSDLSDTRLQTAKLFGADEVINPGNEDALKAVAKYTDGKMIDTSIEAVGVQATANLSVQCLKTGGQAIWVGMSQKEMEINMQDIVCFARRVIGSFNYTHQEFGEVVDLLGSGRIHAGKLITKTVTLAETQQAMEELHQRPDQFIKVMIEPGRKK